MIRISDPRRWEDIRIAFDAITDMDATEGSAHLATIRTTDPELWASIKALLNADAEVDRWLEPIETVFTARTALAGVDATEQTRDPFGLSGRTFSHFQVFEPLGAGGMGVVYRAQDTRLGRAVALKFLLPQYSLDPAAKERFLQEGRSAAVLDHPNLCTIHEVGETDDGRLFLAMPLYPGETLKARLTRHGPLPPTEALEIARQVVQALAAAHAAGIVHRDLKPGNVMLLPGGMIKILDFGLAKVLDRSHSGSGAQFGTVSYMAPEQLRGEFVDGRTDLWALGVVLYEGVTGRRPFGGESEISAARAILYDEPVAPSTLRGDVPALVEEIILTLLAKDPSHRFASAAAVLDVLTTAARPHDPRRAPRIFARPRAVYARRWFQLAGAGVLVATVVALGLVLGFGARRLGIEAGDVTIDAPTRIAVFPFSFHGREQFGYLSEGMVDLLSVALDGAGDLRRVDPHSLLRALRRESAGEPDAEGARTLARQFSANLFVLGNVVESDAQLVISATLYDVDGRVEPIAVAQRRGPAAALPFMVDGLAADLLQDRLKSDAQVGLRQAGTATRTTASLVALKHYLTGEPLLRAGRYDEAAREYAAAVAADSTFALAYLRLSVALLNSINAGGPSQEDVIARAVRHGDRLPQRDRALLMAADAYGRRREQAEAITILRRHVQYYPDDAEAWWRLGEMEFHYGLRSGQPMDQIRAALQRAVDLDSTNMGPLIELRMLAEVEGNRAENLAISRRMLDLAPRSIFRTITQTDVALLTDDPVAARKGIRAARQLDPFLRWLFLGQVAVNSRDTSLIREASKLLIDSLNVAAWRATGHETMAHVEAARGRWGAAKRDIAAFQRLLPDGGMVTLGMLTLTPAAPQFGAEARDVRERLTAWVPGTARDTVRRLYLLGMFAARLGEHEGALAYARALDAYVPQGVGGDWSTLGPEARDRALSVRAESAWRRGALEEALRHLKASRPEKWWALYTNANILETWAYERFMRAEILTQIGRHDEARHWYEALRLNERELVFDAIAQLRLGQAAARRGDSAQAALHYEAVITRWGNADRDVPAYHMEARAALARIAR